MKNYTQQKKTLGFTIIEVLIACSIISVTTFTLLSAAQKGIQLSQRALRQAQANMLLEEGAEAVRSMRDDGWSNIEALTIGTTYYLSYSTVTNTWSLSTTASTIDSVFTRTVVISTVNRDANDDITTSGGTLDDRTKKVTVTVRFPGGSAGTISKTLSLYIADIFT